MIAKLIYESKGINVIFLLLLGILGNLYQYFTLDSIINFNINILHFYNFAFSTYTWIFFIIIQTLIIISAISITFLTKLYYNHFSVFLPSIIFFILMHAYPITLLSVTDLFVFPLLIFSFKILIDAYEQNKIYSILFQYGFIIGILSALNINVVLLFPLVILWLLNFRPFNPKEYLLPLVSFVIPMFIFDSILFIISPNSQSYFTLFFDSITNISIYHSIPLFPVLCSFSLSIFSIYRFIYYRNTLKKIKERRYYLWLVFNLLYLWLSYIIMPNETIFIIINLFVSIILSVQLVSFQTSSLTKLFFIGILMLNFVSIVIML
ncbi:MAG: hypothetical protein N2449_05165 [Bacteroidales bacterium]|nr:hypothetical protein [Bacteroidales bacterium]